MTPAKAKFRNGKEKGPGGLKPLELSEGFRASVRAYPKETRGKIGRALQQLERDFGQPHRHQGLGIRRLTGNFLKSQQEFERELPQPAKFKTTGYYPTKLKVKKINGTTQVSLGDFVYRQAS